MCQDRYGRGLSPKGIYYLPYSSQSRYKGKSFNVRLSLGLSLHSAGVRRSDLDTDLFYIITFWLTSSYVGFLEIYRKSNSFLFCNVDNMLLCGILTRTEYWLVVTICCWDLLHTCGSRRLLSPVSRHKAGATPHSCPLLSQFSTIFMHSGRKLILKFNLVDFH